MTIVGFDYKAFAEDLASQAGQLVPADFKQNEKEYVTTTLLNFATMAGEALYQDQDNLGFSAEQAAMITQIIAEWAFHKSVVLIRSGIPQQYWNSIIQKILVTIFEVAKQAFKQNLPQEQILQLIEHHVQEVYQESVEKLYNKNLIKEEIKDTALRQANIDVMAETASFAVANNNKTKLLNHQDNKEDKIINILSYITIAVLTVFVCVLIVFLIFLMVKYTAKTTYPFISSFLSSVFSIAGARNITIFIVIFAIAFIITWKKVIDKDVKEQLKKLEDIKRLMSDLVNPDRMYERLGVDVLSLQLGQDLLGIADLDHEGQLLAKIAALRQRLTDNLGYIMPNIRITDSSELKGNEYSISIRNNVVDTGFVYPDKYMVIADQWEATGKSIPENVILAEDPIHKVKAYWVDEDVAREAENVKAVASDDIIIQHLQEVLIQQVDKILSEKDIRKYLDKAKEDNAVSEDSLLAKLSYGDIRQVFVNLIKEKVSVVDITLLLSRLDNYSRYHREPDILSEIIRKDFSRQISLAHCDDDKKIYAIDLSQELTIKLSKCVEIQKELNKTKLLLDVQYEHDLVENFAIKLMETNKKISTQPILLCDEKLRLALYRLLVKHIPTVVVLANNEIEQDIKLEIVDTMQ